MSKISKEEFRIMSYEHMFMPIEGTVKQAHCIDTSFDPNRSLMSIIPREKYFKRVSRQQTRKLHSSMCSYDRYKNAPQGYLYLSSNMRMERVR